MAGKASLLIWMVYGYLLSSLVSCAPHKEDFGIPVQDPLYAGIKKVRTVADCLGPRGRFTTTLEAGADRSIFFQQEYDFKDTPFYARIAADDTGYLVTPGDSIVDTLSREAIEAIRGHAFHLMQTRPEHFYADIHFDHSTDDGLMVYNAKDGIGNHAHIFFDTKSNIISHIKTLNPFDTSQAIDVIYDDWAQTAYGKLVNKLHIIQAGTDTFYYHFTTIMINP